VCAGGNCVVDSTPQYEILSYTDDGNALVAADPAFTFELPPDQGIPVAMQGDQLMYLFTREATGQGGRFIAVDIGADPNSKLKVSHLLDVTPTAATLVAVDPSAGNPENVQFAVGYSGGTELCSGHFVVTSIGPPAVVTLSLACTKVAHPGTVVGIAARPPFEVTGQLTVVTTNPSQLLELAPSASTKILSNRVLSTAPTGVGADQDFVWVTTGGALLRFAHVGTAVPAQASVASTTPPFVAGLPMGASGPLALNVVTAQPGTLDDFLQGGLVVAPQTHPLPDGTPTAVNVRYFNGAPFASVALWSGASSIFRTRLSPAPQTSTLPLPAGWHPTSLFVAPQSADGDLSEAQDPCAPAKATSTSCPSTLGGFIHVLVKKD
jgi:hypothetical protein